MCARILLLSSLALVGCGPSCADIERSHHQRLAGFSERAAKGPDARLTLDRALLDSELAIQIRALPAVRLGAGLDVQLVGARLMKAPAGRLGIRLDATFRTGGRPVVGLVAKLAPRLVVKAGTVGITLTASDLQGMEVTLPKSGGLPLLLRGAIRQASRELGKLLAQQVLPALKGALRVEIALPDRFPIDKSVVTVTSRHVQLDVWVSGAPGFGRLPSADRKGSSLVLSGPGLAAVANRAVTRGWLPGEVSGPEYGMPEGRYRFAFGWDRSDTSPARVHVSRVTETCLRLGVACRPTVGVRGRRVTVRVTDARVVDADGSLMVKAAVAFQSLWMKAVDVTTSAAAEVSIRVGGRTRKVRVVTAGSTQDGVALGLDVL